VDEVERIHTADPALRGYLEVAGALLASRGQTLEVGPVLHRLADPPAWPAATTGRDPGPAGGRGGRDVRRELGRLG
jgi:hypothetical protein